ncbi:MAG: enoyl-CoA hydratase-related protein [Chloroflexota bacterium]|nr:enoyl-CoA hydratase-related protein [Chloroflexota bacterium]MDQ5864813.1 enoyl-CoA hydratase-related protein [Chloroflexota bacterium]
MAESDYSLIKLTQDGPVTIIQLNRPDVLNALNLQLMDEVIAALDQLETDEEVRCVVLTGNERAFAAGADIKEMAGATTVDMMMRDQFAKWDRIRRFKKPIIAAVSGYALGGGNELAMLCDMIVASETAQFGQPEINIGVMPGAGGTQRLTRAVGKAVAMDMVLTGRMLTAREAMQFGLVNRVVPVEAYLREAVKLAKSIAEKSPIAVQMAKDAVLKAFDTPIQEGLLHERKNFYMLFSTEDQKEGMAAFIEKRKPSFKGK